MKRERNNPFISQSEFTRFKITKSLTGFTLMELVVVVIIIGVMAGLAIPRYNRMAERFQSGEARENLTAILGAQNRYSLENNGNFKAGSGAGNDLAAGDLDLTINASTNFNTPKIFDDVDQVASILSKTATVYTLSINSSGKITCAAAGTICTEIGCSGGNCN